VKLLRLLRCVASPVGATAAVAAIFASAALALAPYESVELKPLNGSHVAGRIVYHGPAGGTRVQAQLRGVPGGGAVHVLLHAGTCRTHGLSSAVVVRGRLLFHGSPVAIDTVADGRHVFTVVLNGRELACAPIPGMS
jgi:hypothetical protein